MCGIIGAIVNPNCKNKIDANEFIINQFEDQNDRGKDGFGIIRFTNKEILGIDRSCTPMKFLIDLYQNKSESIIAHHRQPTSTDNKIAQTHPIFVTNKELKYDYLVIHNGIIRNDVKLKEIHEKLGYKYTTEYNIERSWGYHAEVMIVNKFNDSESLAIELARYIEKKQPEIKIEGSAAFIIMQLKKSTNKITKICFGRRTNPINLLSKNGYLLLSSEGPGEEIEDHKLFSIGIEKTETNKDGSFIIHSKNLKFEDERLLEEKKKTEEKETTNKENNQTITISQETINQNTAIITSELSQNNIKSVERKKEIDKKYYGPLNQEKAGYEAQLEVLESEYYDMAKSGVERGTLKIANDFEEGIEARQDLISEILQNFMDSLMEPGYDKDNEKPRKTMTLTLISKVLSSLENLANYEGFQLGQAEMLENSDTDPRYKENFDDIKDYTPENTPNYSSIHEMG